MQNVSTGNLPFDSAKQKSNQTSAYFNNFFKQDYPISQNIDNSILAYFETVTGNRDSARVLASTVLYTALSQGLNPMDVITEMHALSQKNLNNTPSGQKYSDKLAGSTDPNAKPGPTARYYDITEIDSYLTVLLNLNRVNTSLLGITNVPQTGKYVSRAILP